MRRKIFIFSISLITLMSFSVVSYAETVNSWTQSVLRTQLSTLYQLPNKRTLNDFLSLYDDATLEILRSEMERTDYIYAITRDAEGRNVYRLCFTANKGDRVEINRLEPGSSFFPIQGCNYVYQVVANADNTLSYSSYSVSTGYNSYLFGVQFICRFYVSNVGYRAPYDLHYYTNGGFIDSTSTDIYIYGGDEIFKKRNHAKLPTLSPVDWFNLPQLAKDAFHTIKSFIWGDDYEGVSMDDPNASDSEKASGLFYSIFKGQETTSDLIGGSLGAILQYVYEIPSSIESKIVSIFVPSQEDFNNGVNSSRDKIFEKIPIDTNLIDDWLSPVPKIPHIYYGSDIYYANS